MSEQVNNLHITINRYITADTGECSQDSGVNGQQPQSQLGRTSPMPHQADYHVCTQDNIVTYNIMYISIIYTVCHVQKYLAGKERYRRSDSLSEFLMFLKLIISSAQ